jgi:hypothetical protein
LELKYSEVFVGILLSDGYITKFRSKQETSGLQIKQVLKHKSWLFYIKDELNKYGYKCSLSNKIQKVNNKIFKAKVLETNVTKELGEEKKHWYPYGIKIVPRDITITPKTLAYWYMGDGGVWRGGKDEHSVKITLYTNGFTLEDNEFLKEKLHELGIESKINIKHVTSYQKDYCVLLIQKASEVTKFMDLVKPYIIPCFKYKLQYPKLVNLGNAPSRTKEAQKAYYHSLPLHIRQERSKKRWQKIKNQSNKERREKYKNDPEYRNKILLKEKQKYKNQE